MEHRTDPIHSQQREILRRCADAENLHQGLPLEEGGQEHWTAAHVSGAE